MAHGGDYQAIEQSFCIIGRKSSIKAEMYNEKMTCNGPVSWITHKWVWSYSKMVEQSSWNWCLSLENRSRIWGEVKKKFVVLSLYVK